MRTKAHIRASLIRRRRAIPPEEARLKSLAAAEHALCLPELADAGAVHLYLPMAGSGEMDTRLLAERLASAGIRLMAPRIDGDGLLSAPYSPGMETVASRFGNPEPPAPEGPVDESLIGAVVVPLVAVDRRGYRLGYGKGFYDRFFRRLGDSALTPCRIGFGFDLQLLDRLPVDVWDEPLDFFVSEEGSLRLNH
ncbi:5-formyltetrahydrofolate cyclo-ligase [Chlorobium sp. N1]|uniref:5-formyltetrahydrofolate cyclo-ligase n=1 Tax=Chlorobium sp. N1 TaxID=2491138 RepID=UPI0013F14676|nr:5-formyltetrahydrofolate cyclo-ligase [Chlorobium sp. N1]